MSETKFTPGPWQYRFKTIKDDWGEVRRHDGRLVAKCVFGWWTDDELNEHRKNKTDPAAANASLIAAAPDLYAALKDLDDAFCGENRTKEDRFRSRQAIIAARAALAKARGES